MSELDPGDGRDRLKAPVRTTIVAAFLLLFGLAPAGPVGRYLGFEVGWQGTGMHRGRAFGPGTSASVVVVKSN